MKTIIAIDPGKNGGVVICHSYGDDNPNITAVAMPDTRRDLINLLGHNCATFLGPVTAYIEKVAPFIPGVGGSQMFEFGRQFERPGAILETLGVRIIEVTPRVWQAALNLGKSDRVKDAPDATPEGRKATITHNARAKIEWKNKLKGEAQRRFPSIEVTLKTADALLILDYAMKQEACAAAPTAPQ